MPGRWSRGLRISIRQASMSSAAVAFLVALPPSRESGSLRLESCNANFLFTSRRIALMAAVRCTAAYYRLSSPWRRVRIVPSSVLLILSYQIARWSPRSVVLADDHASLLLVSGRCQTWKIRAFAVDQVGLGQGKRLLAAVCEEADRHCKVVCLTASNALVRDKIYRPIGFCGAGLGLRRLPGGRGLA